MRNSLKSLHCSRIGALAGWVLLLTLAVVLGTPSTVGGTDVRTRASQTLLAMTDAGDTDFAEMFRAIRVDALVAPLENPVDEAIFENALRTFFEALGLVARFGEIDNMLSPLADPDHFLLKRIDRTGKGSGAIASRNSGQAGAHNNVNIPGVRCEFDLTTSDVGIATVKIVATVFEIEISDARPNTLYTVWVDFKNRARNELSDDYPLGKGALERGVAPAFATTAGVTAGMGLDLNGIITDDQGRASVTAILDYNLLGPGASPVVSDKLAMQGANRVSGYWLRIYEDANERPSLQVTDPETGLPRLERATAQGITMVRHPDFVTHGHTPGVRGVDHFSGFKGDFPPDCLP